MKQEINKIAENPRHFVNKPRVFAADLILTERGFAAA
jgi:hypothetical protein